MRGIPLPRSLAPGGWLGTFRSWLGISSAERGSPPADLPGGGGAPPPHAYGSARVLVVDDNPVNLMGISALLASRGFETSTAADGAEAVALFSQRHFELVLMDLQMPVLDGLGATSAIRQLERGRSRPPVPVVAYTSMSPGPHVLAAHGVNGVLGKPCEDRELEDCLVRWCPGYRAAPSLRDDPRVDRGSTAPGQTRIDPI